MNLESIIKESDSVRNPDISRPLLIMLTYKQHGQTMRLERWVWEGKGVEEAG